MRDAVGSDVELLIDAHGNFNSLTAINLVKRLDACNIIWFEKPVQQNSNEAWIHVTESTNVPTCVGERLYHPWDFVPIWRDRLAEFLMPDILRCGGISELRKTANLAESFYMPVSPHDASGPINILAGAHSMMTVPNFYKLEFNHAVLDLHDALITPERNVRDGVLHLSERPGLGVELDVDFIEAHPDPA